MCLSAGLNLAELGVRAELARKLGIDKSRYARAVIQGVQVTLDKLLEWMGEWNNGGHGIRGRVAFEFDSDGEPQFSVVAGIG